MSLNATLCNSVKQNTFLSFSDVNQGVFPPVGAFSLLLQIFFDSALIIFASFFSLVTEGLIAALAEMREYPVVVKESG